MQDKFLRRYYSPNKIIRTNSIIGKNLMIARKNAGLTQIDVAISIYGNKNKKNYISDIEAGKRNIDFYLFLLLVNLYGQSADYILGLSSEPMHDIYAGHINYIQLCAKKYIEPLIEQMTENLVDYMTTIDKDNHYKLVELSRDIANCVMTDKSLKNNNPKLHQMLLHMSDIVRRIDVAHARKMTRINAHIQDISEKYDEHTLLYENHQYTIPFLEPDYEVVDE